MTTQDLAQGRSVSSLDGGIGLYQALFQTMPVGLGIADLQGNLIAFNDQMMRPGGYTREDIQKIGNVAKLYYDPADRERILALARKQGYVDRVEVRFKRKDGGSYLTRMSLRPIQLGQTRGWQATVEDISEVQRTEQELQRSARLVDLLCHVAVASNTAESVAEAMQAGLDAVCRFTGWPVGHLYQLAEDDSSQLQPSGIWHLDDPKRFARLKEVTDRTVFPSGIGLPGRVLASGKPAWIIDVNKDENFPRARQAIDIGVRAGFGFPVLANRAVVAVLEFFSPEAVEPDERLLEYMGYVGAQLGRAVERARDQAMQQRAEAALRESEERFRRVFEEANVGMVLASADMEMLKVNREFAHMLGYEPGDLVGKQVHEITHSGDVPATADVKKRLQGGKERYVRFQKNYLTRSGETVRGYVSVTHFPGTGAHPPYLLAIVQDITERRRAEDALRESEERFRLLAENVPGAIYLCRNDARYSMMYLNDAVEALTGYPREEFLADRVRFVDLYHPDDTGMIVKMVDQAIEARKPFDLRYRLRRKDGAWRWIHEVGAGIYHGDALVCVEGFLHDITGSVSAEEALRASEERYRAFVGQSSEGIWRFECREPMPIGLSDRETVVWLYKHMYLAECNDAMARMYGHKRAEDMVGKRMDEILVRSDPGNTAALLAFKRNNWRITDQESHERDRLGRDRYFLNNVVGTIERGRLVRMWGTQRDITERKRIEASIRSLPRRILEAQEAERRRVARELHDGVNQLLSAAMFRAALQERRASGKERPPAIKLLERAIQEIRRISHNLRPAVLDDLGLVAAIRTVAEDFRRRTGLKVETRLPRFKRRLAPEIELALYRILQEALTNVERHAGARKVAVRLTRKAERVELTIADDGQGFDPRKAARRKKGRGLGLENMRERAGVIGADFVIDAAPRKGTSIKVQIPVDRRKPNP